MPEALARALLLPFGRERGMPESPAPGPQADISHILLLPHLCSCPRRWVPQDLSQGPVEYVNYVHRVLFYSTKVLGRATGTGAGLKSFSLNHL